MKLICGIQTLLFAVLLAPLTASAQNDNDSADASETIVVASQKSPDELRGELWKAERDFYALYNKLNEDSRYDVRCSKEAPTGSVIKLQTCRPKFLDKALREGRIKNRESLSTNTQIASKMETFRENLATLVAANPDLKAAAATLNSAYDQLNAVN